MLFLTVPKSADKSSKNNSINDLWMDDKMAETMKNFAAIIRVYSAESVT